MQALFEFDLNTSEGRALARDFAHEILAEVERYERRHWKPTVYEGGRKPEPVAFHGEDMTQCSDQLTPEESARFQR
jgi:hypothetical protein